MLHVSTLFQKYFMKDEYKNPKGYKLSCTEILLIKKGLRYQAKDFYCKISGLCVF